MITHLLQFLCISVRGSLCCGRGEDTCGWEWSKVAKATFERGKFSMEFGPIVLALLVLGCAWLVLCIIRNRRSRLRQWEPVKATLKIANVGEVEIQPNYDTVRVAYEAWLELVTRKVALEFQEDQDVIVEVYDSWYDLFITLRDLAKTIPAHRLRESPDTKELVDIIIRVMNEGLRPHLTKWQARFRRWYEQESNKQENTGKGPQEIQRLFRDYEELVSELKQVGAGIRDWAEWLRRIVEG